MSTTSEALPSGTGTIEFISPEVLSVLSLSLSQDSSISIWICGREDKRDHNGNSTQRSKTFSFSFNLQMNQQQAFVRPGLGVLGCWCSVLVCVCALWLPCARMHNLVNMSDETLGVSTGTGKFQCQETKLNIEHCPIGPLAIGPPLAVGSRVKRQVLC